MKLSDKPMKVIGLTGGIASGKSTVAKMLESLGAHIIDADKIARNLVAINMPAWFKIKECFGEDFFLANSEIDRKKLGKAVFADESMRKKLDEIMFPCIKSEISKKIDMLKDKEATGVIVIDAALLIEAGWHVLADEVWLIKIDVNTQRKRLIKRDTISDIQAQERIDSQMSLEKKAQFADNIINNSSSFANTEKQVKRLWKEICQIPAQ